MMYVDEGGLVPRLIDEVLYLKKDRTRSQEVIRKLVEQLKMESYCDGGQACWFRCRHDGHKEAIKEAKEFLGE